MVRFQRYHISYVGTKEGNETDVTNSTTQREIYVGAHQQYL